MTGAQATGASARIRASMFALLAGGMALFGSATPVSKLVGQEVPVGLASALRMLAAVLVLLPALVIFNRAGGPREPLAPRPG